MSFSVVIPCHNADRYVGAAIKSVLEQTVAPKELIIVNDSSTDNSASVIAGFRHDAIILDTNVQNGAASRNIGIRAATGDWVAFLDADDLWYPDHLERIALAANRGSKAFANQFNHISCESTDTLPKPLPSNWPQQTTHDLTGAAFLEHFLAAPWFPGMSALAFDRLALIKCGSLEESQLRRHDIELWIRFLADPNNTWTCDRQPSSAYRVDTPGSLSRNMASKEYYMFQAFLRNEDCYLLDSYRRLMKRYSRRCIAAALTYGSSSDITRAYQLAGAKLSGFDKLLFGAGLYFPNVLASIIRVKRRVL